MNRLAVEPSELFPRETPGDFDAFWKLYPRKIAKQDAARAWAKMKPAARALALEKLPAHLASWSDAAFIPYPATWLNGERWEDELEPPKVIAWWASDSGTMAHGRSVGIPPRAGESMEEYRARLRRE